ncbi:hypothetical protein [Candidatus Electrothrix sp.]|uniref:hypothetical protein n=1 Tax=Candidatus Electrothrix sp. TaxID=2170559 RepID=UPI004057C704
MPKENGIEQAPGISLSPLLSDIREIVDQARSRAYSAVNTAMVQAYWLLGKRPKKSMMCFPIKATNQRKRYHYLSIEKRCKIGRLMYWWGKRNAYFLNSST